jgi:hypothetical protein
MNFSKTLLLDNNQTQILDLNGDTTNFTIDFNIKGDSPFEMCLTTQDMLDHGTPLDFKKIQTSIAASVRADTNEYKNYIIVVRSQNPNKVQADIEKKIIEPKPQPITKTEPNETTQPPSSIWSCINVNYKFMLCVGIGVVGLSIIGYLVYKYNKKEPYSKKNNPPTPSEILKNSFRDHYTPDTDTSRSILSPSPSSSVGDESHTPYNSRASSPDTGSSRESSPEMSPSTSPENNGKSPTTSPESASSDTSSPSSSPQSVCSITDKECRYDRSPDSVYSASSPSLD